MDFSTTPFTSITNAGNAIISRTPAPSGVPPYVYVPAAGEKAINYVEVQLAPVVNEISTRIINVIIFIALMIVICIIVPLFLFAIWYGVTARIKRSYLIGALFGALIVTAIVGVVVYYSLTSFVNNTITTLRTDLSDSALAPNNVLNLLDGASKAYILAT